MVYEEFGIVFEDELVDIVKECSSKKLWRGSLEERKDKFLEMHNLLKRFFALPNLELRFEEITEETDKLAGASGGSYFNPEASLIVMKGRLSVVTYLHEFGHAIGCDQERATKWSLGLFKICFPLSYSNLVAHPQNSSLMIRQREVPDPVDGDTALPD